LQESQQRDVQADVAATIGRLRRYYASVDKAAKNAYIMAHTYFAGYEKTGAGGGTSIRKNTKLYDYLLPPLDDVKLALGVADQGLAYPPSAGGLRKVCSNWFFFVLNISRGAFFDTRLRASIYAKRPYSTARDLDVGIPAVRDKTKVRSKAKADTSVNFLMGLAAVSESLPNEDKGARPTVVLPTRTSLATHQLYVHDEERRRGVPWVDELHAEIGGLAPPDEDEEEYAAQMAAVFPPAASVADLIAHRRRQDQLDMEIPQLIQSDSDDSDDESDVDDAFDNERLAQSPAKKAPNMRAQGLARGMAEDRMKKMQRRQQTKRSRWRYGNKLCGPVVESRPEDKNIASYGHFCKVWAGDPEMGHIICRSYLPFAKCDTCVRQRSKDSMKRTQAERDADIESTAEHLRAVSKEKLCYYMHRTKATKTPGSYLSMIIDGADQSKYNLPYWCERSHASDDPNRLKMHLYGVLCHGRRAYTFVVPDHEAQGHNPTIQIIWQVIVDQYVTNKGVLPSVLFLQLDNTTRQNKGRYVLAFLALLVEHGIFERVYVCFLPVGHTHEDIDQMFSRFAIALRNRNMLSRQDMTDVIKSAFLYNGAPCKVVHWDRIANISGWLKPHLIVPKGCMRFRHFRVARSEQLKVMVQCREKMRLDMEEDWRGIADNTHRTYVFRTGYGIPDLYLAAQDGSVPDSWKRNTSKDAIKAMRTAMKKLSIEPSFTQAHQDDCEEIIALYEGPALKFNWDHGPIRGLLGKGGGRSAALGASVAAQEHRVAQQLGQDGVQIGLFYMVRPTTAWSGKSCLDQLFASAYKYFSHVHLCRRQPGILARLLQGRGTPRGRHRQNPWVL
jgi:hypothetical protein